MKQKSVEGFTLVEVVMAIAVVSFCLVVMLGLFSSGMVSSRKSTEDTRLAALTWTIANEIQTNSANINSANGYSNYFAGYSTPNYYNVDGQPTNAANAFYTCQITPAPISAHGTASIPFLTNSLQMVLLKFTRKTDPGHTTINYVLLPPP